MARRGRPAQRSWTRTLPQTPRTTMGEACFRAEKKAPGNPDAFISLKPASEAESRAERYPQIVVGSVLEVDLVAHLGTQPDRSHEAFHASSRIDGRRRVAGGHVAQRALKAASPVLVRHAQVDQAGLEGSEQTNRSAAGTELRSEQRMQSPQVGAY